MGLPLQSLDHGLLTTEPPVLTPGRRKPPPQGPQDHRLDAGMINILHENPLTPNTINKKFLSKIIMVFKMDNFMATNNKNFHSTVWDMFPIEMFKIY